MTLLCLYCCLFDLNGFFFRLLCLSVQWLFTPMYQKKQCCNCVCVPNLLRGATVPALPALFLLLLNGSSRRWLFWTDPHTHLCDFGLSMDILVVVFLSFPPPKCGYWLFCGRFDQLCRVHKLHLKLNKSSCSKSMYF